MEPMTLELVDETPSAPNGVPAANNTTLPASATSHAARTYTPFLPPAAVTSRVAQTPLLAAATTYQRSREQRLAQRRAKDPRRPILFHDVFGVDDDTEDPEDTVRPLTETYFQMFCAMVAKAVDTLFGLEWNARRAGPVVSYPEEPRARRG